MSLRLAFHPPVMDRRKPGLAWWMRGLAALGAAALAMWLSGCAALGGVASPAAPRPPLADDAVGPPAMVPRADAALAVSPAMRAQLQHLLAGQPRGAFSARGLIEALATRGQLRLEYEARTTRTAAQAFDDRAGNCLSLVLMTAAFARELNLPVTFNEALVEAQWRRDGDLLLRSGHVNLTLGPPSHRDGWRVAGDESLMVDFLPGVELRGLRTRPIDERRVLAMYLNNRAAEWLAEGDVASAYWWVREAVLLDASYRAARNTLGVVYLRLGRDALAEQVFEQVLAMNAEDTGALANLALVRVSQGRLAEAAALRARREALEPEAPGVARARGLAALEAGDPQRAVTQFELEIARHGSDAALQGWLAQAQWRLGQPDLAERALGRAVEESAVAPERARYQAKLAWLRAQAAAGQAPARQLH